MGLGDTEMRANPAAEGQNCPASCPPLVQLAVMEAYSGQLNGLVAPGNRFNIQVGRRGLWLQKLSIDRES